MGTWIRGISGQLWSPWHGPGLPMARTGPNGPKLSPNGLKLLYAQLDPNGPKMCLNPNELVAKWVQMGPGPMPIQNRGRAKHGPKILIYIYIY